MTNDRAREVIAELRTQARGQTWSKRMRRVFQEAADELDRLRSASQAVAAGGHESALNDFHDRARSVTAAALLGKPKETP